MDGQISREIGSSMCVTVRKSVSRNVRGGQKSINEPNIYDLCVSKVSYNRQPTKNRSYKFLKPQEFTNNYNNEPRFGSNLECWSCL